MKAEGAEQLEAVLRKAFTIDAPTLIEVPVVGMMVNIKSDDSNRCRLLHKTEEHCYSEADEVTDGLYNSGAKPSNSPNNKPISSTPLAT